MLSKTILNKLLAKCIIHIFMPNLYSFCYIFIYKCILKYISIKCIIMDDFLQKKSIEEAVVNMPFAGMSVLLKDFVFAWFW